MSRVECVSVYVTAGSLDEAQAIGRALVEERLVACVNVLPGARSLYRWEGEVEEADEVVMLAKTRLELAPTVCARVAELHAYEVPCCVVLPILEGWGPYLDWIAEETEPA